MRLAGRGEAFPIAAMVGTGYLVTSARAMTDLTAVQFDRMELTSLCERDDNIGRRVYKNLAAVLGERYHDTLSHLARSTERDVGSGCDLQRTEGSVHGTHVNELMT